MPEKIRIVIVDDHQVIRTSWKLLFDTDSRCEVVALCRSGSEALDTIPHIHPDVVLMDINMAPMNGFEATRLLLQQQPSLQIIGISANNYAGYAQKILGIGAKGFVTKSSPFDELVQAVRTVNDGHTYVCREVSSTST